MIWVFYFRLKKELTLFTTSLKKKDLIYNNLYWGTKMNIKIYKEVEEINELKIPVLRLIKQPDNVLLVAVDDDGERIIDILCIYNLGVHVCLYAKDCLDAIGYDTSFTMWDEKGAVKIRH